METDEGASDDGEEVEVEVEVEVETEEGVETVEGPRDLERRLKDGFGRSALTTSVEDDGGTVVVNGDGWRFEARAAGEELSFKPGGASYRIVRDAADLETVERDGDGMVFVFADETITLGQGIEHRR